MMREWIVTPSESGLTLWRFLLTHLGGQYSARSLKRLIDQQACRVNNRIERFSSKGVGSGDHICCYLEPLAASVLPDAAARRILYEDEALLVYDKPAGMNSDSPGVLAALTSPSTPLELAHRLDKETTGVLLLTKQPAVLKDLQQQFKTRGVHKSYRALVDGLVGRPQGSMQTYLGKKKAYAGQTIWGSVAHHQGRYARTDWHVLKRGAMATLLACQPETGRTHQIRVHLAEMGHPILGDGQYGRQFQCAYRPPRCLLHAQAIRFRHPVKGHELHITAPLPDDFDAAERQLFN